MGRGGGGGDHAKIRVQHQVICCEGSPGLQGLGLRVLGFRVQGFGFRALRFIRCRVLKFGFRLVGLGGGGGGGRGDRGHSFFI